MSGAGPRIGLALGGGGARGLAHIVLLEAMEELGLAPALIAGTSMGAVVGAARAAGMTARAMRTHALHALRNRRLLLGRVLEARVGRFADLLRRGVGNPVLVDAEVLLPLLLPPDVPASFEALALPLAVIATDFDARREVVLEGGDLRSALAASAAVPGLVRPVMREGLRLIDGGTVNPLPYERLFGQADHVVACDVSFGTPREPGADVDALGVVLGAAQIMQATMTGRQLRARPPNLLVRPPVERFRLLDFHVAARILEAADAAKDAIKADLAAMLERGPRLPPP